MTTHLSVKDLMANQHQLEIFYRESFMNILHPIITRQYGILEDAVCLSDFSDERNNIIVATLTFQTTEQFDDDLGLDLKEFVSSFSEKSAQIRQNSISKLTAAFNDKHLHIGNRKVMADILSVQVSPKANVFKKEIEIGISIDVLMKLYSS